MPEIIKGFQVALSVLLVIKDKDWVLGLVLSQRLSFQLFYMVVVFKIIFYRLEMVIVALV